MSLRTKAVVLMISAIVLILGALYFTARFTLMRGLQMIEEHEGRMYVERALSALSREISELETTVVDWASWDDTYAFVKDANSLYIKSNLANEAFLTLRLNLMLFLDSSGQIVFSKAFDLVNKKEIPVPADFLGTSFPSSATGPEGVVSGLVTSKGGPMIIVGQPILTTAGEGPARGTLFFGRYVDGSVANRLAQVTLSDITMFPIGSLPPDFPVSLLSRRDDVISPVKVLDGQHIGAYGVVNDVYGAPALGLRVTIPRETYILGQESVIFFVLALLGVAFLIGGAFLWLVHSQLLVRIATLIEGINRIAKTGDATIRINLEGRDELAAIAGTINGTLTVLREEEEELQKAIQNERELRRSLEEEIEHRAEYTRALVHELKTPLTPIMAASELLLEEVEVASARSLAANIQRSAANLNRRIDELLDLARGETGQLQLLFGPVDPASLLKETTDEARSQASLKEQTLALEISSSLQVIFADKERLQQVVLNLLNNAIKFTPGGGKITIRAEENATDLVVKVEDSGRGISEEEQKRLFDPYHRREGDRDRLSGLGLGLAIAKKFVDLHGGRISVESVLGKGTVFTFTIPLRPVGQDGYRV